MNAMSDALGRLPDAIRAVAPSADIDALASLATAPMRSQGIVTARRAAMFIGQCSEETGGFTQYSENTNYSAKRLIEVFPSHFTPAEAATYAGNAEMIANRVYANRYGNGDEASGDGWRFRGAGGLQITFRDIHAAAAKAFTMTAEAFADWARTPAGAMASACWYWGWRGGLNALCDTWNIEAATQRINGGLINLPRRITMCNAALAAMGEQLPTSAFQNAPGAGHEATADDLMAAEQKQLDQQS